MSYVVIDCETVDLSARYDDTVTLWAVGLYWSDDVYGWYSTDEMPLLAAHIDEALGTGYKLVFHNASFDVPTLRIRGVNIPPGSYDDTMLMSYALLPSRPKHSLGYWGEVLGYPKGDFKRFSGPVIPESWEHWWSDLLSYLKRDCEVTSKLYEKLKEELDEDATLSKMYSHVDLPFTEVVIQCEQTGLYIDSSAASAMREEYENRVRQLGETISNYVQYVPGKTKEYKRGYYKRAGITTYNHCKLDEFNPGSNAHKCYALQHLYGWEPSVFTDSGQPKLDKAVMQSLDYPLTDLFLEQADKSKQVSTFLVPLTEKTDDYGVLRGSFNQCVTLTGRLSSSGPEL